MNLDEEEHATPTTTMKMRIGYGISVGNFGAGSLNGYHICTAMHGGTDERKQSMSVLRTFDGATIA